MAAKWVSSCGIGLGADRLSLRVGYAATEAAFGRVLSGKKMSEW
jgi:hypothetical protein